MLRRGIDRDVLVLAGYRQRDVSFEIEMVLAADAHRPLDGARRGLDRGRGIAPLQGERRRHHLRLGGIRIRNIDDEGKLLIGDLRQPAGAARLFAGLRDHREHGLAEELDLLRGQHRLIVPPGRADVVLARHVVAGHDVDHAGSRADGPEVHLADDAVGHRRQAETAVQRAGGFRHVVDIDRGARHVLVRGIVTLVRGDATRDMRRGEIQAGVLVHGVLLTRARGGAPSAACPSRWSRDGTA